MELPQYNNILIIQTAFIGDVILTTPMFAALKEALPFSRLTVMIKPEAVGLLQSSPSIDELLVIDKKGRHRGPVGMLRFAREIRKRKFDVILSPHQSHRTSLLCAVSGVPLRFGYRSAGFASLAYHKTFERPSGMPEIVRLLKFLDDSIAPGSAQGASRQPQLFETEESTAEALQLFSSLHISRAICIAPSSVWPTKRWTPWGFAELAGKLVQKYNSDIVLIGSKGDRAVSEEVIDFAKILLPEAVQQRIHDLTGKTSLLGLYSLIKRCRLLISNDSAPVHLGSAAGIPLVAIFGPTIPAFGFAPISPGSAVTEIKGLPCRPCGTHGSKRCPEGHFRCMKGIGADDVLETVAGVM